jgi:hypothetical protein
MHIKPWIVYTAIIFLTILPLLLTFLAGIIANMAHCQLDEGSIHPCIIWGKDWGSALYTLGMMGWFMFFTMPAGFCISIIYTIYLLVRHK